MIMILQNCCPAGTAGIPSAAPTTRRFGNVVRWLSAAPSGAIVGDKQEPVGRRHEDADAPMAGSGTGQSSNAPMSSAVLLQGLKARNTAKVNPKP